MHRADRHGQAAETIARQLVTSVFSDDVDAIEALQAKIAKAEANQVKAKTINAAIRKHAKVGAAAQSTALVALGYTSEIAAELLTPDFAGRVGVPSYVSTNNAANIRRMKARIEEVEIRQARSACAAVAGVLVDVGDENIRVTFAAKPDRAVIDALRAAGFSWGGGAWTGKRAALPEGIAS